MWREQHRTGFNGLSRLHEARQEAEPVVFQFVASEERLTHDRVGGSGVYLPAGQLDFRPRRHLSLFEDTTIVMMHGSVRG